MAFKIRTTKVSDFNIVKKWWNAWEDGPLPTLDELPNDGLGGLMLERDGEPTAVTFLWLTNSKMGYIGYAVRDPDKSLTDDEAISLGLQGLKTLKEWGCTSAFMITKLDRVIEKSKEYGFGFSKKEFANGFVRLV